ncbi:DUF3533 domain-containing protein [Patulibacter sp. NPDC049589]|uniref:DUF3533 domain-containing protein n=1 Tax=Patulibacter sp. NPDC049589 TaxID=3154731 RepID=UPI003438286C
MSPTARRPLVVGALVLFAALVLQLAFAGSYVGALHEPRPHEVPITVVGPDASAGQVAKQLNVLQGSPLKATTERTFGAARDRVEHRRSYAVLVPGNPDAGRARDRRSRLYVASAANRTMATVLPALFERLVQEQGAQPVQVKELAPLPAADQGGLAAFYAVVSWMVGGYFGATLLGMVGSPLLRSRRVALQRLGGMLAFGVLSGLLSALLLQQVIGVLGSAPFLQLAGTGALCVVAVGASTIAFQSLLGIAGTGLAVLLFVVLGNPSSGGPYSPELLPGFWRAIGEWLPPGAGTTVLRDVTYFDGHATGSALLVLAVWAVVGAAVAVLRGGRGVSDAQAEREAMAGVGAV